MMANIPPQLLPAATVPDSDERDENSDNCENARGVSVPVLNIEPRVERGIQVFTAIGSTYAIRSLDQVAPSSSVVVFVLLVLLMAFCERIESSAKSAARKWAPKAFSSPIVTFLKVLEFSTTLSIFVVISYAIMLLSGLWIDGNLTFAEVSVTIIIFVAIAFTIAVAYHDVHETLERAVRKSSAEPAAANKRSVQTQQQQQQQQQQQCV